MTSPRLAWARRDYLGHRPNFVHFDTGAEIHWTLLTQGLTFAALPASRREEVGHYGGMTRRLVRKGRVVSITVPSDEVSHDATERLRDVYGINWEAAATSAGLSSTGR